MIQNPIYKVLSTFSECEVKSLLIGGQACILYGAAEFSRDTDFVILCNLENIKNIKKALKKLKAIRIYVPSLNIKYLLKGHACHFKCQDGYIKGLRVDILAKLRGCSDFNQMWKRRTTVEINKSDKIEIIGLKDLVASKKTQRDKDWMMLTKLVDNDIFITEKPDKEKIKWWFKECRSIENLEKLCITYKSVAEECTIQRPLLKYVLNDKQKSADLLKQEELEDREKDKKYWLPLRKELEILRHREMK